MANAHDAAFELVLAAGKVDAVVLGAVLDYPDAVHAIGKEDAGDAPGVVFGSEQLETHGIGAATAELREGPLLAVHGFKAAFEEHAEAFFQPDDEVHGRGEMGLGLAENLFALSRQVEVEAAGLDVLANLPGALGEGEEGEAGGQHEALLGAGEQAVHAPLVHGAGGNADA